MATFGTGDLKNLPRNIADGIVGKVQTGSVVAALSGAEPQRFGDTDIITFNDRPRAEFVEEGGEKSSTTGSFGVVTAVPHKAQVTMRFNQEVQWADEDYQLQVLSTLANAGALALSRALDLGLLYRINPLSGAVITAWTNYLNSTTKRVSLADASAIDDYVDDAVGLVVDDDWAVNGIAFAPKFAHSLARLKDSDGRKKYPELGFGTNVSSFATLPASVSSTVSGTPEATEPTNVDAIVGDFQNGIIIKLGNHQGPLEVRFQALAFPRGALKRDTISIKGTEKETRPCSC